MLDSSFSTELVSQKQDFFKILFHPCRGDSFLKLKHLLFAYFHIQILKFEASPDSHSFPFFIEIVESGQLVRSLSGILRRWTTTCSPHMHVSSPLGLELIPSLIQRHYNIGLRFLHDRTPVWLIVPITQPPVIIQKKR
jgi:hypothetical protein